MRTIRKEALSNNPLLDNFCVPDPAHNADVAAFLNNTWGIHLDIPVDAFDTSARAKQAPWLRFPLSAWDGVLPGQVDLLKH